MKIICAKKISRYMAMQWLASMLFLSPFMNIAKADDSEVAAAYDFQATEADAPKPLDGKEAGWAPKKYVEENDYSINCDKWSNCGVQYTDSDLKLSSEDGRYDPRIDQAEKKRKEVELRLQQSSESAALKAFMQNSKKIPELKVKSEGLISDSMDLGDEEGAVRFSIERNRYGYFYVGPSDMTQDERQKAEEMVDRFRKADRLQKRQAAEK